MRWLAEGISASLFRAPERSRSGRSRLLPKSLCPLRLTAGAGGFEASATLQAPARRYSVEAKASSHFVGRLLAPRFAQWSRSGGLRRCKLTMRSSGPRGEVSMFPDMSSARGRLTRRWPNVGRAIAALSSLGGRGLEVPAMACHRGGV
jgi:hypothetical protein